MFNNVKQVNWPLLAVFFVADMALTLFGVAAFSTGIFAFAPQATGELINETLVVNLVALAIGVGLVVFWLCKLRPHDVGLVRSRILQGAGLTLLVWALVQAVDAVVAFAGTGEVAFHPSHSRLGIPVVIGLLLGQLFGNALYEEIAYRGFILPQVFKKVEARISGHKTQVVWALVISQGLFALRHIPIRLYEGVSPLELAASLLFVGALGAVFAIIYLRTGSLFFAVGVHAIYNSPTLLFNVSADLSRVLVLAFSLSIALLWPLITTERKGTGRHLPLPRLGGA